MVILVWTLRSMPQQQKTLLLMTQDLLTIRGLTSRGGGGSTTRWCGGSNSSWLYLLLGRGGGGNTPWRSGIIICLDRGRSSCYLLLLRLWWLLRCGHAGINICHVYHLPWLRRWRLLLLLRGLLCL